MRTVLFPTDPHVRILVPERMDEPCLDPKEHARALRGLARLHILGRSAAIVWPLILRELRKTGESRLSLLDVACGRADLLTDLYRRSRKRLDCTGIDISDTALRLARRHAPPEFRFLSGDVRSDPLPPVDIVLCSLFLHHLEEEEAIRLLKNMRNAARRLLVVIDLLRDPVCYRLVRIGAFLATTSSIVRTDSGLSVRAAFTWDELSALALRAGMHEAVIHRRFPCRLLLAWNASGT
jgi:SAM-dependent methyltransferase